jgi:hypothetical protein
MYATNVEKIVRIRLIVDLRPLNQATLLDQRRLDSQLDKEILDFQVNNTICEAIQCFAKATNKIDVKVGESGVIPLYLCKHCVRKFDRKVKALDVASKQQYCNYHQRESEK